MVGGGSVYEGMRELECSKLVRAATPTFVEPVRATTITASCWLCRYIAGKVFIGHTQSEISVYHRDESECIM